MINISDRYIAQGLNTSLGFWCCWLVPITHAVVLVLTKKGSVFAPPCLPWQPWCVSFRLSLGSFNLSLLCIGWSLVQGTFGFWVSIVCMCFCKMMTGVFPRRLSQELIVLGSTAHVRHFHSRILLQRLIYLHSNAVLARVKLKSQSDTWLTFSNKLRKIHLPIFLSVGFSPTLTEAHGYMLVTFE